VARQSFPRENSATPSALSILRTGIVVFHLHVDSGGRANMNVEVSEPQTAYSVEGGAGSRGEQLSQNL